ncbi:MAG TPA: hypothetical protein V6D43_22295 [Candidatus Sericytochromatia bacterium]|jgi:hypothetical protein
MANQEFVVESDSEASKERSAERTTAVSKHEEIIEDFGLARLMKETEDEDNERLSKDEALTFYLALKGKNTESGERWRLI